MHDTTNKSVYIIDYDAKFMLCMYTKKKTTNEDDAANQTVNTSDPIKNYHLYMYGKINVILFLCSLYQHTILKSPNTELGEFGKYGEYILNKLNDEYYSNPVSNSDSNSKSYGFYHIRDYIQTLYISNRAFRNVCHHYKYAEGEMLKIRYFTYYKLPLCVISQINNKPTPADSAPADSAPADSTNNRIISFFKGKTIASPLFAYPLENNTNKIKYAYYEESTPQLNTIESSQFQTIEVYSVNRLRINTPQKTENTPQKTEKYIMFDNAKYSDYIDYISDIIVEYEWFLYSTNNSDANKSDTNNSDPNMTTIQKIISFEKTTTSENIKQTVKIKRDLFIDQLVEDFDDVCSKHESEENYYNTIIRKSSVIGIDTSNENYYNMVSMNEPVLYAQQNMVFTIINDNFGHIKRIKRIFFEDKPKELK